MGGDVRLTAGDIREAILVERPDWAIRCEQTGGGTATIYIGDAVGVAIGPGSYDWADEWLSTFWLGDTAVGPDDDGTAEATYPDTLDGIVDAAIAVIEPDHSGRDEHGIKY